MQDQTSFLFAADSESEVNAWVKELQRVIDSADVTAPQPERTLNGEVAQVINIVTFSGLW